MNFSQFLAILRARFAVFLATALLTVGATVAVSLLIPKQYTAVTTVVIDSKGADPVLGVMMPVQMMPGYLATQIDIIQSKRVAREVVKALRVSESPGARQQWQNETSGAGTVEDYFAELFLKKLDVRPSRESSVIEIGFTGSDPTFAATVANAFAQAYQRTNLELRVQPARQSAAWFDERMQQLRKDLEAAQTKLNAYQREKGFTAQDERLDLEQGRLSELSMQYTAAQAQAVDASSRERQLREFLARGASPETLPDVLANPLIQNLKSQLSLTEGRLQQMMSQLGRNHPEVKRLEADIEGQKAKVKGEIASAAASLSNSAKIAQRRESELRAAVADQKARLLSFNLGRDEQQVLIKEVENAQRAFDVAAQRSQQTNLESQSSQTNIAILSPAVPPVDPSFPRLTLNVILSIVLGLLLGLGVALLMELLSRRIRSAQDLAIVVGVPVLGVLLDDKALKSRSGWGRNKVKPKGRIQNGLSNAVRAG
jgi:chain length determinant protein EpsF